jgi:peptidyl-prolyl cis-trans isomerase C
VLDVDRDTTAVAPAAVRAEYERTVAAWPSTLREYHLRQIVRSSQALANASLKRLHEPDPPDFAALAGIDSDDAGGATRGGDVGWVAPDSMPSAIAIAVQALDGATGLVDYAISTGDSWHVVEVLGSRAVPPPPFDQVREQVAAKLRWRAVVPDATWAQALQP